MAEISKINIGTEPLIRASIVQYWYDGSGWSDYRDILNYLPYGVGREEEEVFAEIPSDADVWFNVGWINVSDEDIVGHTKVEMVRPDGSSFKIKGGYYGDQDELHTPGDGAVVTHGPVKLKDLKYAMNIHIRTGTATIEQKIVPINIGFIDIPDTVGTGDLLEFTAKLTYGDISQGQADYWGISQGGPVGSALVSRNINPPEAGVIDLGSVRSNTDGTVTGKWRVPEKLLAGSFDVDINIPEQVLSPYIGEGSVRKKVEVV